MIRVKRAYEKPGQDGYRILIDRLWPRGLSKEKAKIHLWMKDVAPSDKLRKWFAHDPEKWAEFQRKYKEELKAKKGLLKGIKQLEQTHKMITLLFAAKDQMYNNAVVLQRALQR